MRLTLILILLFSSMLSIGQQKKCSHVWIATESDTVVVKDAPTWVLPIAYNIEHKEFEEGQEIVCVRCLKVKKQVLHRPHYLKKSNWYMTKPFDTIVLDPSRPTIIPIPSGIKPFIMNNK